MFKFFKFFKTKVKKESKYKKYKVSHDPYGGGYVVGTNTKHVEYFKGIMEAHQFCDKLNKKEEKNDIRRKS